MTVAKTPERELARATVDSLNHDARGVARVDGKVTFIEGALPGEEVAFRHHRTRESFDTGVVVEVLRASPDRITPRCPHFGTCGGCALQHMAPPAQIAAKQQVLADALTHIGRVSPTTWLPPMQGTPWHYRRRARLGVRFVEKKGGVLVGFREKRRAYITPLSECPVLDVRLSALLPALRDLISSLSCPDRVPQIEVAIADNAAALVFRHLVALTDQDREKLFAFGQHYDLQMFVQPGGPESIAPVYPERPEPLTYTLPEFDVRFEFGPSDFIQVNAEMNARLVQQALALLELAPTDTVLDLFCGLGNFTLPLARRAQQVLGIDAGAELIAAARANAERNRITNVEFRAANLYNEADPTPPWAGFAFGDGIEPRAARQGWRGCGFNKLLLDPPRTGAIEAIKRLAEPLPARIVYVSCYPATLARDSGYLVSALGYRLSAAGVIDMFPHTSHVESLALFTRP